MTCQTCPNCSIVGGNMPECRANPPKAQLFPGPDGAPITVTYFPNVQPATQWCGLHPERQRRTAMNTTLTLVPE